MKSYTDLEQSKKLAEILPPESADMHWSKDFDGSWFVDLAKYISVKIPKYVDKVEEHLLPCWSLAALLGVLPDSIYDNTDEFSQLEFSKKSVAYIQGTTDGIKIGALKDNLVDACYEMILKLHELKML